MQTQTTDLKFDPVEHRYFIGDKELISVNKVIDEVGFKSTFGYSQETRDRGRAVHTAIHLDDVNDLDEFTLDEGLWPYLSAWRKFRHDTGVEFDMIEGQVYNEVHGYAGTVDRVGRLNGRPVIIDMKTGSVPVWTGIQLAAYKLCLGGRFDRFGIRLGADGSYSLHKFDDVGDEKAFLAALVVVRWKRNHI